jgi:hypothetical protein
MSAYMVGHGLEQQQSMNYENRRAIISQQRQIELQRREILQLQQIQSTE